MFVVTAMQSSPTVTCSDDYWPWMVVIATFITQFIVCGITYSLGVFHIIFKDTFYESHFDTSWIGSILLYVTALTSIMFRFVTNIWGPRVSIVLGGLLASLGLSLSMFAQEIFHLYLSFGLITGLGFGLACSPSIIAVERYFVQGRFQALSAVVAGVGAGIITFPLLIHQLILLFAWRGAMLILAGIALNICVCGMVMKPTGNEKDLKLMPLLSCFPLRHPLFHGMCLANLFWSFGSTIIYMYLPSYAMLQGTSFEMAVLLMSCIGISSFSSRMMFAFMGPSSTLDIVTSSLCSIGIGIVITGICPLLFDDLSGQIGYTILFGFYSGFWTAFLSQVSNKLLGPEYTAMGNGYLSFMIALGALTSGPLTGLLLEYENDFKYVFYLAGSCLLWSSIVMVLFKMKCRARLEGPMMSSSDPDIVKGSRIKEHNIPLILEDITSKEGMALISGNELVVEVPEEQDSLSANSEENETPHAPVNESDLEVSAVVREQATDQELG